ncbi:MAG: biopolymer transporter ExbD [Verrucomicrobiota bacterium]
MARKTRTTEIELDHKSDMSSMIDLVFLLLIFFMVTATLIDYKKDDRVDIPIADNAEKPEGGISNRVVINILPDEEADDGRYAKEGGDSITLDEIKVLLMDRDEANGEEPIKLHVRGDSTAGVRHYKRLLKTASEAGISQSIFSTYQTAKGG